MSKDSWIQDDWLWFWGYIIDGEKVCRDGTFRKLVMSYLELGYTLINGPTVPFDDPQNKITDLNDIEKAITRACNFDQRNNKLVFWRPLFEFRMKLYNHPTNVLLWVLDTDLDLILGPNYDAGEKTLWSLSI